MPLVRKAPRGAIVVRAVAFGDPDGSIWAAGLDAGAPALIAGGGQEPVTATIGWDAGGPDWELHGDSISLTVTPVNEPPRKRGDGDSGGDDSDGDDSDGDGGAAPGSGPAADALPPSWAGRQELCRVTGTLAGTEIDCTGVRTELEQVRASELGSIRCFSAWLSGEEAVTLLALRPASESDHEQDLIAATMFDPDGWLVSSDPRLSTTYDGDGHPTRATLELWISEGEREFPRRAAGEAAGAAVTLAGEGAARAGGGAGLAGEGAALRVLPLRCHSRGSDGAGTYLLASL